MKQKEAGIKHKTVAVTLYPGDILRDLQYLVCADQARGFYLQCLLHILANDTDRISLELSKLSVLCNAPIDRARSAIIELIECKPCDILLDGVKPDMSQPVQKSHIKRHTVVTVINRRRLRMLKARESDAYRKRQERERRQSQECHIPVQVKKGPPSLSSSLSSSQERLESLSKGESALPDGIIEILHKTTVFRRITKHQIIAIVSDLPKHTPWSDAIKHAVKAAAVAGDIYAPGPFLKKCLEQYCQKHRSRINAIADKDRERETDLKLLADLLADTSRPRNGLIKDMARRYGQDFIDQAETISNQKKEKHNVRN